MYALSIHILQGYLTDRVTILWLPNGHRIDPEWYKHSVWYLTTTKHTQRRVGRITLHLGIIMVASQKTHNVTSLDNHGDCTWAPISAFTRIPAHAIRMRAYARIPAHAMRMRANAGISAHAIQMRAFPRMRCECAQMLTFLRMRAFSRMRCECAHSAHVMRMRAFPRRQCECAHMRACNAMRMRALAC